MTEPYLTAEELRARVPDGRLDVISDPRIEGLIAEFEDIVERYRGVAYTTRTVTETPYLHGDTSVLLGHRPVTGTITATLDGVEQSVTVDRSAGVMWLGSPVTGEMSVTYSHGMDSPPELVLHVTAEYVVTVAMAQNAQNSRDIISQSMDGTTVRFSTPSWKDGRPTGWTEVDRLLNSLDDCRLPVA